MRRSTGQARSGECGARRGGGCPRIGQIASRSAAGGALFARPLGLVARGFCGRTAMGSPVILGEAHVQDGSSGWRQSKSIWARSAKAGEASRIACEMHCQLNVTGAPAFSRMLLPGPRKTRRERSAAPKAENGAPQGQDAAKLDARRGPRKTRRERSAAPIAENRAPRGQDAAKLEPAAGGRKG